MINIYFLHLLFLRGSLVEFLQSGITIIYTFAARKTDEPSACHQPFWIFIFILQHIENQDRQSSNLLDFFNVERVDRITHSIIQFHNRKV